MFLNDKNEKSAPAVLDCLATLAAIRNPQSAIRNPQYINVNPV